MKETTNIVKSLNINNEEYVVLACSYGPDSMVLLDLLTKCNLKIIIAHVNHKLRKESDKESQDLENYCLQNNLLFESAIIEEYPKGNTEMNARNFRYEFFKQIINKYHAKYLFTAHHGDDLMETIIMRLSRGSTFKGYAGFNKVTVTADYTLIRPLIEYTKSDIIKYAQENNIPYAIDQTNFENTYTRNRIRSTVLPELKKENPSVHKKFIKFNEIINNYELYFSRETEILYQKLFKDNTLQLEAFKELDPLFQNRLLELICQSLYHDDIIKINNKHVNMIIKLINSNKNTYVNLPNNLHVSKSYNILAFNFEKTMYNNYEYEFIEDIGIPLGKIEKLQNSDEKSNYLIRLNSSEISLPLHVRTREKGDTMQVKNMLGTKKINDIFIENKLSKELRDIYPIVTDNIGKIIWIPGLKKSNFDKQIEETYDIILKYTKKGEENEK